MSYTTERIEIEILLYLPVSNSCVQTRIMMDLLIQLNYILRQCHMVVEIVAIKHRVRFSVDVEDRINLTTVRSESNSITPIRAGEE